MRGTIVSVNTRGFFFVRPDGGRGDDHFGHAKDLDPSLVFSEALKGVVVDFNSVRGEKGLRAADVRPAGAR